MRLNFEKHHYWQAFGIYTLLVAVYFYPLFLGQVIGQTDFLLFVSPWIEFRPDDWQHISNSVLQDQSTEFLPFFLEAKSQLKHGLLPLWNPYILMGTPLWANTQSALLFPLNFGHYLFAPPLGFTFSSILKIILTGFFTYIFARKIKISHFAALVSGVLYSYAMFNMFWLNHPHTNATMLLPLSLYFGEHFLYHLNKKTVMQFALLIMLTLFSGHVEITFIVALATAIYLFIRAVQLKKLSFHLPLYFFSSYVLACLLAAVLLVPFVEFLLHSATWGIRGEHKLPTVPIENFMTVFFGKIFVSDAWKNGTNLAHAHNLSIGITALPLILFAIRYNWKKSLVFVILSVLALLTFFDIASFHSVLMLIPIIKQTPLFYFVVFWLIAASILAAIGLDEVIKQQNKNTALFILTLLVIALATVMMIKFQANAFSDYVVDWVKFDAAKMHYLVQGIILLLSPIVFYFMLNKYKTLAKTGLFLVLVASTWLVSSGWNPSLKKELAFVPKNDAISHFFADFNEPFRVFSLNNIMRPSTNMLIKIPEVQGYDVPVSKRYHNFFIQVLKGKDRYWRYNILSFDEEILPYLKLLNTSHILSKKKLESDELELKKDGKVKFYALKNSKKRAFMMYNTKVVQTPQQALTFMQENKDKLSDIVVLENSQETENITKTIAKNSIKFYSQNSQKIKLKVTTQSDGWLVLSQSYYPGWYAYIDDKKVDILPADYLLQAIKMPKGEHQVRFVYRPLSFYLGLIISLFTLGMVLWQLKRKK